jgi:hypothetical protein
MSLRENFLQLITHTQEATLDETQINEDHFCVTEREKEEQTSSHNNEQ